MDNEHRILMERVAKSLETLANPPPPVELTDRIADLETQLEAAIAGWRGWHAHAVELASNTAPELERMRRENGSLTAQLHELSKQRYQVEAHLKQSNIDLARASRERRELTERVERLQTQNTRLLAANKELDGDDNLWREKCEKLRHRAQVLQGRLSYWKRKNK